MSDQERILYLQGAVGSKDLSLPEPLLRAVRLINKFISFNYFSLQVPVKDDRYFDALEELSVDAEQVLRIVRPELLVEAVQLLSGVDEKKKSASSTSESSLVTVPFWRFRAKLIHQKFLSNNSKIIFDQLNDLLTECDGLVAKHFAGDYEVEALWNLEKCQFALQYSDMLFSKLFESSLDNAKKALQISVSKTGKVGKRTKYQADSKIQLYVDIETESKPSSIMPCKELEAKDAPVLKIAPIGGDYLLERTAFEEELKEFDLSALELCVVSNEFQRELNSQVDKDLRRNYLLELAERILSSKGCKTSFVNNFSTLFYRSLVDGEDSHYRERAIVQFDNFYSFLWSHGSHLAENEAYLESFSNTQQFLFFGVNIPTTFELCKAMASFYEKLELIESALRIYEKLDLWEEIMFCYVRIGLSGKAKEMLLEKLASMGDSKEDKKKKPLYLCVLGDVSNDPTQYSKSWDVSDGRCSRAMRSLGMHHYSKKEYEEALPCLKASLEINSMFPDTWFALGHCYLEKEEWAHASQALSQTVVQRPELGEAWNDLAKSLALQELNESAFHAIKQCVRFLRSDAKVWDNYLTLALRLQDFGDIMEALDHLADLRGVIKEDLAVLKAVSKYALNDARSESSLRLASERFGKLLLKMAVTAKLPEFFQISASFFNEMKRTDLALDAYAKQVHCIIDETPRFETEEALQAVVDSLETCVITIMREKLGSRALEFALLLETVTSRSETLKATKTYAMLPILAETVKNVKKSDREEVVSAAPAAERDLESFYGSRDFI